MKKKVATNKMAFQLPALSFLISECHQRNDRAEARRFYMRQLCLSLGLTFYTDVETGKINYCLL